MSDIVRLSLSRHRIIHSEAIRLPRANGDRDITMSFAAPGRDSTGGAQTRPYLSYQVRPGDEARVALRISINGTNVVDQTLSEQIGRTYTSVIDHGVVEEEGNELRLFVPTDPSGSVVVSDLIVVYTAEAAFFVTDDEVEEPQPAPGDGF